MSILSYPLQSISIEQSPWEVMVIYTEWATKKLPAIRFARVLVMFCVALVCILRRVFEQSVNCRAVTTFNIYYDGLSFQHLATVLIPVFTLCYAPGLLLRGPLCITKKLSGMESEGSLPCSQDSYLPPFVPIESQMNSASSAALRYRRVRKIAKIKC